jgi:hypothetical protein
VSLWGYVRLKFGKQACDTVRPRQRFWEDLHWEIQAEYLRRLSYRQIKVDLDQRLESSVGLRTLNQPVLVLGSQAGHFSVLPPGQVPPVVRVNGIWITVMFASGETQTDQAGRQRAVKHAKKVPILTAQGVWPATGQTRLLAWMRAEGEDASSWQTRQAKAVQSLGRYLDETLAFYAVLEQAARRGQQWPARRLRTTSPLERMLRSSWLISGKIDSHG